MRDLVITGLAHLLTTNTDIGLKHFLPLGYDPDPGRRAIFCHVVSRVMDLGGKFETASDAVVASRRIKIGEVSLTVNSLKTYTYSASACQRI